MKTNFRRSFTVEQQQQQQQDTKTGGEDSPKAACANDTGFTPTLRATAIKRHKQHNNKKNNNDNARN